MKYLNLIVLSIVILFSANLPAGVESVTFDAFEDAYVDSVDTGDTFNSEELRIQGVAGSGSGDITSKQQSFIKFEIDGLEEKTIISVRFQVYLNTWSAFPPAMVLSYVEDDSWNQGTGSPTNDNGINWINQPSGTDISLIGPGEAIDDPRYYGWWLYQKDTPIDHWEDDHLADDGFASYMLTVGNEDLSSFASFSSGEVANPPQLIIEYIPEPASMILLGLGTVLIRKRRIVHH